uniref:Uncharacterized protein n=1 Tax=Sphaerodactylus townsendi TaxID=933632 RepID=A0ACB8ED32_9SAUR
MWRLFHSQEIARDTERMEYYRAMQRMAQDMENFLFGCRPSNSSHKTFQGQLLNQLPNQLSLHRQLSQGHKLRCLREEVSVPLLPAQAPPLPGPAVPPGGPPMQYYPYGLPPP